MIASFSQKLLQGFRQTLPPLTTFLFILASVLVWPLPYVGSVVPMFGLVAVYYWAIYRPDLFRPLSVFLLGLMNDIVHFLPLGLSAFVFVAVYQLAFSQRRFFMGQIFYMLWSGFGVVAFLAMILQWLTVSVVEKQPVAFLPVFIQFLFTLAAFPLPAWILIRLQRAFLTHQE